MIEVAGLAVGDLLHESANSVIYHATTDDGTAVIVKLPPEKFPSHERIARLRREYDITASCSGDGIIRVHSFEHTDSLVAMIIEDFGGRALKLLLTEQQQPDLATWLEVAIRAVEALGQIHRKRIMHKDINPSNILWNRETGEVKIIDFGIATELSRENPSVVSPSVIEGTLAYMSPEQTGRMNRSMDYRTDLYSLGATFYQLFTGVLPFQIEDPMGLVHAHLAHMPTPAHELNVNVPEMLSRVIDKLLAKNAEDRYQSTMAARDDLMRCRDEFRAHGTIPTFELGTTDVSEQFQIPQTLYGRSEQLTSLLDAFERVATGGRELVLVAGYSGIGKSALVHEVHKPIAARRGYFISGKFDQFSRNIPYASLIQAFKGLIRQLLTESDEQLARWRAQLRDALGVNGGVIVEVIPEIELIIGEQPAVPVLPPTEAQNRFNRIFDRFVRTFASKKHPLTLFLDDLQWTDGASLKLMRQFVTEGGVDHMLLIGAYRDNEVDVAHPLMLMLDEMVTDGARISTISLGPLAAEHTGHLIADTLHRDVEDVANLNRICLDKTGGNPFFLNQFLRAVYDDGGIDFDRELNRWRYDLEHIERMELTENVVELMAGKIRKLPETTQHVLRLAACIGASFDLHTLSIVNESSAMDTAAALWAGIESGLLLPVGSEYKFLHEEGHGELGAPQRVVYRWLHDRVQQAAYSLLGDERRKTAHGLVGRLMLEKLRADEREDKLFEIVNHLNIGAELLTEQTGRDELADLNLTVGRKAIASAAYEPALRFSRFGLELLGADRWQRAYEHALELTTQAAVAANLIPDFKLMEQYTSEVMEKARTVIDQVRAYEIRILAFSAQAKVQEAIRTALEILRLLGVEFPAEPGPADVGAYLQRVTDAIGDREIEHLIEVPENPDPAQVAAIRILVNITSTSYIGAPALFPLIVLEAVALSAKGGDTGASAYAYVTYGIILCGALEQFDTGYRFGELGPKVIDKHQAKEYAARTAYIPNCYIKSWKEHARVAWASHTSTYQLGLDSGDQEFAGWALMKRTHQGFFMGLPLAGRIEEARRYVSAGSQLKLETSTSYTRTTLQAMLNLVDDTDDPVTLVGQEFDEEKTLPKYIEASEAFGVCNVYVTKLMLCTLFEHHERGLKQTELLQPWSGAMLALLHVPVFHFYDAINRLAIWRDSDDERKVNLLAQVDESIDKMRNWADHCPDNYRHKYLLMMAERHASTGDGDPVSLYREGITGARDNDYLQEVALGNELAGRYWLRRGETEIARMFIENARKAYTQWGAHAKARHLSRVHATLFVGRLDYAGASDAFVSMDFPDVHATATGTTTAMSLDVLTVLKASQAISSEVQLSDLLRTMSTIVIENAGADRGSVIFEEDGHLRIAAMGRAAHRGAPRPGAVEVGSFELKDIDGNPRVPVSVVQYVARTGESLVLDNAAMSERFSSDPYVATHRPRSMLVKPIMYQGKLTGVLYLENRHVFGVFTERRLNVLDMLTSQAAISLQNARLYHGLQSLTEAQQRFVPYQFLESLDYQDIAEVDLGVHVAKEMSVMFCDLRGFTPLTERLGPAGVIRLLNGYFGEMEPPIIENGGFIDSFNGDEIMALFDVSPDKAVRAGISMRLALKEFNRKAAAAGETVLRMGIGLNTGSLLLGTVGGRDRIKCGVVGDPVNLASRIEQLTKRYETPFLIGETTYRRLARPEDISTRVVDRVAVKGKMQPVTLYEVLDAEFGERRAGKEAGREALYAGFAHYYARAFEDAIKCFEASLSIQPDDVIPQVFIKRCRRNIETPPGDHWTGVEKLTTK